MRTRRRRIPSPVEDDVLFLSDHTCCICRTKGKDVQIHHIDGNPANDGLGNLESKDVEQVLECVRTLGTLADFNCEFGHGRKATVVISRQAENFFEIGLWYSRNQILNAVIRVYRGAIRACYTDGRLEFPYGQRQLRKSVRNRGEQICEFCCMLSQWSVESELQ